MAREEKYTTRLPVIHVEPEMRKSVEQAKADMKQKTIAATVRELIRLGLQATKLRGAMNDEPDK